MSLDRPTRYRCALEATLELASGAFPVRILDLSETGAFVETSLDLQFGDAGVLAMTLPEGDVWRVSVTVVRLGSSQREVRHPRVQNVTVLRCGAGLQFTALDDDALERLRIFLEKLDEQ